MTIASPPRPTALRKPSPRTLPDLRSLAELVRAPAALTVPGDALAGAAAAGRQLGPATLALTGSSVLLYWAGMALNDYADRDLDAVERPERPIPSGRVRPGVALGLAAGLTTAGVGVAGLAGGRRALAVAVPLAATVWAYDLKLKATPAGPAAMATARALDVLLGAGAGSLRAAAPPAAIVAAHTLAVTTLSRREVSGGGPALPAATLATTGAVALAAAAWPNPARPLEARHLALGQLEARQLASSQLEARRLASGRLEARRLALGRLDPRRPAPVPPEPRRLDPRRLDPRRLASLRLEPRQLDSRQLDPRRLDARRLLVGSLAGCYLATYGSAQAAAVADPGASRIRRAVGAGILGLVPLQASLIARRSPLAAGAVAALFPLARRLSRKVSPT